MRPLVRFQLAPQSAWSEALFWGPLAQASARGGDTGRIPPVPRGTSSARELSNTVSGPSLSLESSGAQLRSRSPASSMADHRMRLVAASSVIDSRETILSSRAPERHRYSVVVSGSGSIAARYRSSASRASATVSSASIALARSSSSQRLPGRARRRAGGPHPSGGQAEQTCGASVVVPQQRREWIQCPEDRRHGVTVAVLGDHATNLSCDRGSVTGAAGRPRHVVCAGHHQHCRSPSRVRKFG
jgi:hypothetical protein